MRKLNKTEKNAQNYCNYIKSVGSDTIIVEWRKSATWGSNPVIMWAGSRACSVSGCGYCKLSTALAETLRFLGETPEQVGKIWQTGGAGVSSVARELAKCGWQLEQLRGTNKTDIFSLKKIEE